MERGWATGSPQERGQAEALRPQVSGRRIKVDETSDRRRMEGNKRSFDKLRMTPLGGRDQVKCW